MLSASEDDEDETNPMKALEDRTKESKQEMDILDALEEIKDLSARKQNGLCCAKCVMTARLSFPFLHGLAVMRLLDML